MQWFVFAIFTAFFESLKDVSSKKGLKNINEYMVAWSLNFFALPFLIPILFFVGIPSFGDKFWFALIIGGGLNVITTILYMKAIKYSDLSITVPMVSFTPLFLLITSPLIVGEFPTMFGLLGVILIVIGSYVLNIREKVDRSIFPKILTKKGPRLMLIVAFIWSITSNFDKIGVQNSSPILWAISISIFITLILTPIMLFHNKKIGIKNLKNIRYLIPVGLFGATSIIFQMIAISLSFVIYVISIKRTSSVISILFGYLIFNEKGITERLLGAFIMITGILLITFYNN